MQNKKMIGTTFLTTQEYAKETENQNKIGKTKKCPTCTAEFLETSDLNKHRAHSPKCQNQWQKEKPWRGTCNYPNFGRKFHRETQLHIHQSKHEQKTKLDIYNLNPGEKNR